MNQLTKELVEEHLGEIFYQIRFGMMSSQEFSTLLPKYEVIFSAVELCEIFQMINNKSKFLNRNCSMSVFHILNLAMKACCCVNDPLEENLSLNRLKRPFLPQTKIYGWYISNANHFIIF